MRSIPVAERRARLQHQHLLRGEATSPEAVATQLVGLHSSDPATVYLSAWARCDGFAMVDMEASLYDKRSLLRLLGMRRTMFVVDRHLASVMTTACTRALAAGERRRLVKLVEDQGLAAAGDGGRWIADLERATLAALERRGTATASELKEDVPDLGLKLSFGAGKKWAGTVGMTTRLMFLMATDTEVVRGRPRGSWLSSQYEWASLADWVGDEALEEWETGEARAELVRMWLATYGPGTIDDLKWWTGWGVRDTRRAIDEAGAEAVSLGAEEVGYVLTDDPGYESDEPVAAFLPGLDPATMGWKEREWYLGPHAPRLFDSNGNAGPTVWWGGMIVGGWGQGPDGDVRIGMLEDVSSEARDAVEAKRLELESWLDGTVVSPRFRCPLERELASA